MLELALRNVERNLGYEVLGVVVDDERIADNRFTWE